VIVSFCVVVPYPLGVLCAAAAFQSGIVFSTKRPPFTWSDVLTAAPSGWFALIAWASFYFGIKLYLELEEKHRQLLAIERLAREAEIRALRYQLQPHFLFNTLNAISTLVLSEQIKPAMEMIGKLAHLLRAHWLPLNYISFRSPTNSPSSKSTWISNACVSVTALRYIGRSIPASAICWFRGCCCNPSWKMR